MIGYVVVLREFGFRNRYHKSISGSGMLRRKKKEIGDVSF